MNGSIPFRIAVLGCADKRFLTIHKRIFQQLLNRDFRILTFDVVIEHMEGERDVVRHDCTLPLPNGPFDFVTSHVLLKFIPKDRQFLVVASAQEALTSGGIAAHILDHEDIASSDVDLATIKELCKESDIQFKTIDLPLGVALITMKQNS